MKLAYLILAAAVSISIIRFRELPPNLRYLVGLVVLEGVTEITVYFLHLRHQPNLFVAPIFSAGELWLLALVYDRTLHWPAFSRWRPWLAGLFVAYCALDSMLSPEVARFKPTLQVLESLLVLGLVGLYFRKLLHDLHVTRLGSEPMFWVSTGLIINHLGNLQIYLFSNFLLKNYSNQLNLSIWAVHSLLLLILYSCYCVALWIRPQK